MKRSVLAITMAGILVLASPNPAWAYNRDFTEFKILRAPNRTMKIIVELGLVEEQSPPSDCRLVVPVKVQFRDSERWIGVLRGRTDRRGRLVKTVPRKRGRYRAVAPEFTTDAGNQCFKAVSRTITFP